MALRPRLLGTSSVDMGKGAGADGPQHPPHIINKLSSGHTSLRQSPQTLDRGRQLRAGSVERVPTKD